MRTIQQTLFRVGGMVICASLLAGCASIISKSAYPVSIASTPDGATATVLNSEGERIHTGVTPMTVNLKSGAGYFRGSNYSVVFEKDGYVGVTVEIRRSMDGWYIGNILFGGLIGFLIVDPATGAMWRLEDRVHGRLTALDTTYDEGAQQLQILALDDVPEEFHEHLVRIN